MSFDPDQPRDEHGQWTDGGGGDKAAAAAEAKSWRDGGREYGGAGEQLLPDGRTPTAEDRARLKFLGDVLTVGVAPGNVDLMRYQVTAKGMGLRDAGGELGNMQGFITNRELEGFGGKAAFTKWLSDNGARTYSTRGGASRRTRNPSYYD